MGDYTNPYQFADLRGERGNSGNWFPNVFHQSRETFWFPARVHIEEGPFLPFGGSYRIVFRALPAGLDGSDIAIDDIKLVDSGCSKFLLHLKLSEY